jgi:hypothetical protein
MGRAWKSLLEVIWIERFAIALNYGVLCLVTANGDLGALNGPWNNSVEQFLGLY